MTIYAIINELSNASEVKDSNTPIWTLVSNSSLLQGGNPYFVPDFANTFELRPALAVKIGKLGKGIPARFAHRYISGVAPCSMMLATDLLERLKTEGLPWTQALSYDRSTTFGLFTEISAEKIASCTINVQLESADNTQSLKWTADYMPCRIEEIIECLSRDNTLKTGDIIIAGVAKSGILLTPGMRATMTLDGVKSPGFNIR